MTRNVDDINDVKKKWPEVHSIDRLFFVSDSYIIFLNHDKYVEWRSNKTFNDEQIKWEPDKIEYFHKNFNEIARLDTISCDNLEEKVMLNYKQQIGQAVIQNFNQEFKNAEDMLRVANDYVINRLADKSRFFVLKACGVIALIATIIGCFSWLFREFLISFTGVTVFYLWLSFLMGSLGAFLSIVLRIGKIQIDYQANENLHYLEGATRVFVGMISGLLIALCVKTGILLPVLEKVGSTYIVMVIGGLIAGASERLVPSLIQKVEGSNIKISDETKD
jgi:kynurenine formamidase